MSRFGLVHWQEYSANERESEIAVREFKDIRKAFTLTNFENRPFVLVDALTQTLSKRSPTCKDPFQHDLQRLIATSHFKTSSEPPLALNVLTKQYRRIFFILIEVGHPEFIESFFRRNLRDARLPLERGTLEQELDSSLHNQLKPSRRLQKFYDDFCEKQFEWCPMVIEQGMRAVFCNQVVPFLTREAIRPSGNDSQSARYNAKLFTIEVPEELLGEELKKKLSQDQCWERRADKNGETVAAPIRYYKFALKQFPNSRKDSFERENKAFMHFGVQEGMIQYVGCCEDTDSTSSIILELGDCDLYTTIRNELPPVSQGEIEAFWFAMSQIAKALAQIQKLDKDGLKYNVWHGDVKPENILRVGDRFKLADPGEACFVISQGETKGARTFVTGGTRTYAAPEQAPYLDDDAKVPNRVTQNSDAWSLGCVFSIAATYVVLGTQGVLQFDEIRQQAASATTTQRGIWKDAFYDGETVRKVVTDWHIFLRSAVRWTDQFTADVLNMVDEHVLVPAENRWDAIVFSQKLEELMDEKRQHPARLEPEVEYIEEMLQNIDLKVIQDRERSSDGRSRVESDRARRLIRGHRMSENNPETLHFTSVRRLLGENIKPTAQRSHIRTSFDKTPPGSLETSPEESMSTLNLRPIATRSATLASRTMAPHAQGEPTYRPPTMTMWQLERMLSKTGIQRRNFNDIRRSKSLQFKGPAPVKGQLGKDDHLEKYYKNRDIIYLVDNGPSMLPHWGEACFLLRVLVWRSLGYDEDGMELYFTNPDTREGVRQRKNQWLFEFEQAMNDAEPHPPGNRKEHKTNLVPKLTDLINSYVLQSRSESKAKPRTIIVLTDGVWEGDSSADQIQAVIKHHLEVLAGGSRTTVKPEHLDNLSKTRPFTIQFISFGHDQQGIARMAALDDDIKGYPDLVDVEPSNGDVYKMFLGSLDDIWDNKVNNVNHPPPTPARSTTYTETVYSPMGRTSSGVFTPQSPGTPVASPLSQGGFDGDRRLDRMTSGDTAASPSSLAHQVSRQWTHSVDPGSEDGPYGSSSLSERANSTSRDSSTRYF